MIPNSVFTVYKLVNNANGRMYYGRTKDPEGRQYYHTMAIRRGIHYNTAMINEDTPKGWTFVIIKGGLGQREANRLSDELAKEDDQCYNKLGVMPSNPKGSRAKFLSQADVDSIRALYFAGEHNQVQLATMFGVTQGLISLTVNGLVHNAGEFTPPKHKPIRHDTNARGKHSRLEMRERMAALTALGVAHGTAVSMIAEEFNLHKVTVRFWLKNEPIVNYRDMMRSSNLTHAPSTKHVLVDGERFYSAEEWVRKTGRPINDLRWLDRGKYCTIENRTVTVDGKEYVIGAKHVKAALRELKLWPCERVGELEYKTVPQAEGELRGIQKKQAAALERAKAALLDPVLTVSTRKILFGPTAAKHRCSLRLLKALVKAAEPAGS